MHLNKDNSKVEISIFVTDDLFFYVRFLFLTYDNSKREITSFFPI